MKRLLAVAIMIVLLCICLSSENLNENHSLQQFTIGWIASYDGGPFKKNFQRVIETAGGKLVVDINDISPIGIIISVNRLIHTGCDGILVMPTSESILPQIAELCEDAGVYWSIFMRPVFDPKIRRILEDCKYYVGSVIENDEEVAYDFMKLLWENGKRNVVIVSTAKSDPVVVARERGLYKAAKEFGMDVVAEIYNASSAEDTCSAVSDVLIARPEIDAVFRVSGHFNNTGAIIQAIEETGKEDTIKCVCIDFDGNGSAYFDKNIVLAMAGGHHPLDTTLSAAMLINALIDPPATKAKQSHVIDYLVVSSSEELSQYYQFYEARNGILFSADAVKRELLNSGSQTDYNKIISEYTMENIRKINQNPNTPRNLYD